MKNSCIRQRANARLAILHEDYLEICKGNMLAAMLLAVLIYWTDIKISKKDSNLWVWKSHSDFQEDLMFDKPGMKPPHRTTIKTALDLLEEKKFIYRRKNPKLALDQTKQYLVDQKAVQSAIDALPPIVGKATLESRNTDNGMSENQHSMSENRQCIVEIPTSNTNDYSTEITVTETTDNEEGTGASAPTPALSSAKDIIDFADTASRLKAVREQHEQDEDERPTERRIPAVKVPATHPTDPVARVAPALSRPSGSPPVPVAQDAPRAPGVKQAPLSLKDDAPRPPGEKALRSRYEAHFWQMIEDIRTERGLQPPTYGKTWKGLRENQEGVSAFYADAVPDASITAGYVAMLESSDAWLRNNFTVMAFFKRLQGLLDGKKAGTGNRPAAPRVEESRPTRNRRNFSKEYAEEDARMEARGA